ncbi:phenylalanine--tRNA ligase subunit beta [Parvularcula sp. LCG005]|uniref:phenylalanine--tRNA ligase subunit beta n=1 Tax=Parvularcula sp. LCG005 TaxID=3078805 RepID=UPI002942F50A|nr:phenylalanine--tRNA ligase subunit beta [Parvularcula sp. LCG005]WOI53284.1 phenylalanine--tRNA ligase subunit beta [Parvularcula sp. LCG005]
MKFTLSWLKKHLQTEASLDDIAKTMVKVGLEVEEIENPADRLSAITVGHVVAAEPHPDADKLQICTVETKDGAMQIVCGAPNARKGIKVAYAPVGTYIAGLDITLSKAKIRGVESLGMLCSSRELEVGEDHDGIMELPADATVGTPLADILGLDNPVIDFEVTPNRPDTNGVTGVARDLAAAGLGTFIDNTAAPIEGQFEQPVPVMLDAPDACLAFGARYIRGVKNGPSPKWLQDELRAIGLRPINALVDVTNYVSYDRARPLHVYDAAKLNGGLHARMGKAGEEFEALDKKTYTVDETMCVIADESRVLGLGGIIGGVYSGCTTQTTDVLIECAVFDTLLMARTGRKTGIISDARYRNERGIDPASINDGLELATQLILDMCGGEPSEISITGEAPTERKVIEFSPAKVEKLTGMDVSDSDKERILTALGFDVKRGGTWEVTVPTFRPDIEGQADLVEEIARIHGLDHLPTTTLPVERSVATPGPSLQKQRERTGRVALVNAGYDEAVTWAFCEGGVAEAFGATTPLKLSNPISSDLDTMRPGALPNLVAAIGRNVARGASTVRLFEIGGRYNTDQPSGQESLLCAVAFGAEAKLWNTAPSAPDVFTMKSLALSTLEALDVAVGNLMTLPQGPAYFHPGRKGQLGLGPKNIIAQFGEIHPAVLKSMDVAGPVAAMEIFIDNIPAPKNKGARTKPALNASALMPVRRDFAFVVKDDVKAEALLKAVRGADKRLISAVRLFDVYQGTGVPEGHKSIALEITLQPTDKTLTDEEIDAVAQRVIAQATKAVDATLRG